MSYSSPFSILRSSLRSNPSAYRKPCALSDRKYSSAQAAVAPSSDLPRWRKSHAALTAPVPTSKRQFDPFPVNTDSSRLDRAFHRFLGPLYTTALPSEQAMWLSVTHKSFDQGRQGFNDRLSYLGKRIVNSEASAALVGMSGFSLTQSSPPGSRAPLACLAELSPERRALFLDRLAMSKLGRSHELDTVIRWAPKNPHKLVQSGQDTIVAQALYAIVGAIALEKGGDVAARVANQRIIRPLGG